MCRTESETSRAPCALLSSAASITSWSIPCHKNQRGACNQRLHEQGRVQFVDVILVHYRLVKASQPSRDPLRQLRVAIVEQPGQQEPEQPAKTEIPVKINSVA